MNRKSRKQNAVVKEYVTVAFAEDLELGREYEKMLIEHGIPAIVKNQGRSEEGYSGIAVMVPEEFIDEAYAMVRKESSYDDFFDAAFGQHGGSEEKDTLLYEHEEEDEEDNF